MSRAMNFHNFLCSLYIWSLLFSTSEHAAEATFRHLPFSRQFVYNEILHNELSLKLKLTKTFANRLSNSLCSGIGCAARLRTLACRTWWFCCWGFHKLPLVGVVTNTDTGLPLLPPPPPFPLLPPSLWLEFVDGEWIVVAGAGSLDDDNPMAFLMRVPLFYICFACHTTVIWLGVSSFRIGYAAAFGLHGRCRRHRLIRETNKKKLALLTALLNIRRSVCASTERPKTQRHVKRKEAQRRPMERQRGRDGKQKTKQNKIIWPLESTISQMVWCIFLNW